MGWLQAGEAGPPSAEGLGEEATLRLWAMRPAPPGRLGLEGDEGCLRLGRVPVRLLAPLSPDSRDLWEGLSLEGQWAPENVWSGRHIARVPSPLSTDGGSADGRGDTLAAQALPQDGCSEHRPSPGSLLWDDLPREQGAGSEERQPQGPGARGAGRLQEPVEQSVGEGDAARN